MTVSDPCTTSHRPTHPGDELDTARTHFPPSGVDHAPPWSGQQCGQLSYHEPPAGLGPWIPPLPTPEPPLSPHTLTWLGIAAGTVLIGAAAAIAVMIGVAAAPVRTGSDVLYLDSVRNNSALTTMDVSDADLIGTGHAVCTTLDARPSTSSVLDTMQELGASNHWADDDVAAVVGSAIGAYCPRHITLVDV